MKNILFLPFLLALTISTVAYSQAEKSDRKADVAGNFTLIGQEFSPDNIFSSAKMGKTFQGLKPGDTVKVSFQGKVATVCQKKGCWMTMNLENGDEVMVKFKDYAFFVPANTSGKEVILNGKAYVTEMSVEEQKHYAGDAGKSAQEIAAIKKPARKFSFLADGVKIKK